MGKLLLDFVESFMPLAVSDLVFRCMRASKTVLRIQISNLGDFRPETPYFVPKNFKVIHPTSITHFCRNEGAGSPPTCQ